MASPSHRSTMSAASASSSSLVPPPLTTTKPERRMTSPNLPPPSPLNLPEPERGALASPRLGRPPSPLRNGFTADESFSDDEEEDNDRTWGRSSRRSHSPTPSITKFAANFAQRVNSFVNNMNPRSPNMLPSEAELEAEAERERERSRREAERILIQEAEERRLVEDRVLAMLQNQRASPVPSPSRSQSLPTPPSPSTSSKEGGSNWWAAAKNKLTPTKESLTPAQQLVKETKAREKEEKAKEKERRKSQDWPSNSQTKYADPSFRNLVHPTTPLQPPRPLSAAPSTPPSLAASPMRTSEGRDSPHKEAPPLYAQFDSQGALDVQGTLLVIAKRFEKLERWTVGHVRALEERMGDVEKWLVDKEKEREEKEASSTSAPADHPEPRAEPDSAELSELREELAEVQGRIGELGREIAKLATAPANLSSVASRNSTSSMARAPSASSSYAVRHLQTPSRGRESTSPPVSGQSASRTRLPYPTGDYASPPDSGLLSQGIFSPASSPPASLSSNTRAQTVTISGLPMSAEIQNTSTTGLPRSTSPMDLTNSPGADPLPAPRMPAARSSSVSPTPRKRYTVALGEPVVSRSDAERPSTPAQQTGTAYFSSAVVDTPTSTDEEEEEEEDDDGFHDETIGKSARFSLNSKLKGGSPSPSNPRLRAQSTYGLSSIAAASPNTPLHSRMRSRSTDMRFGLGISMDGSAKFVDPLVIRKQEKEATSKVVPPKVTAGKKVPVRELAAFFDGEKR